VIIGGVAAEAHGVGWQTWDLDIVIASTESNYEALTTALTQLGAEFDTLHVPPIRPDVERLRSATGALLFRTNHGRLDVLKEAGGDTYESLMTDACNATVEGLLVHVVSLAALLRMKRAANRPKDRAVLASIERAMSKTTNEDE
jgi:hypothetical protein